MWLLQTHRCHAVFNCCLDYPIFYPIIVLSGKAAVLEVERPKSCMGLSWPLWGTGCGRDSDMWHRWHRWHMWRVIWHTCDLMPHGTCDTMVRGGFTWQHVGIFNLVRYNVKQLDPVHGQAFCPRTLVVQKKNFWATPPVKVFLWVFL